jgi:hypothetical protein
VRAVRACLVLCRVAMCGMRGGMHVHVYCCLCEDALACTHAMNACIPVCCCVCADPVHVLACVRMRACIHACRHACGCAA